MTPSKKRPQQQEASPVGMIEDMLFDDMPVNSESDYADASSAAPSVQPSPTGISAPSAPTPMFQPLNAAPMTFTPQPQTTPTVTAPQTTAAPEHEAIQVATSRFDTLQISQQDVITFEFPVLGFEELRSFILLPHNNDHQSPFFWLQSVEDGTVAFVVTHPILWNIPMQFEIEDEMCEMLGFDENTNPVDDILLLCIVNIPNDNPKQPTINLRAPIVINQRNKRGGQIVLQDDSLAIRHPLLNAQAAQQQPQAPASQAATQQPQ